MISESKDDDLCLLNYFARPKQSIAPRRDAINFNLNSRHERQRHDEQVQDQMSPRSAVDGAVKCCSDCYAIVSFDDGIICVIARSVMMDLLSETET